MSEETITVVVIIAAAYFIPTVIATTRKTVSRGSVGVINLLLGWTFVGWVVALAMAFGRTEAQEYRFHGQTAPMPPGFYRDAQGTMRWWDGNRWGETQ